MNSPKKQVLKAIQKLGNSVTVADVVARTGYSLQRSTTLLNEIAAETSATLQVDSNGKINYCFQPNFQLIYFSKGAARILANLNKTFGPILLFLFKISFGLTLVLSVAIVFGIVLILRSLFSIGSDSGESVSQMWIEYFAALRKFVTLDFRRNEVPSSQGFLLDCYYFLFGPGDPNAGIEETRWSLIAQTIRLNEGVILAEHLVPYTGRPPEDEQALFAVLAKFDGQPVVSDSGDILYIFPSIGLPSEVANYAFTSPLVQAQEWQFSGLSRQAIKPVILLAVANMLGTILFFSLIAMIGGRHGSDLRLFAFFSVYGILFLTIPAVRFFILRARNMKIRHSNKVASEYEEKIGKPDFALLKKLEDAEHIRRTEKNLDPTLIVYRTDRDYLEQISDELPSKKFSD